MAASKSIQISANLEDYLEAIYHLQRVDKVARAKDVADRLGVSRASVTSALKSLAEKGLIQYKPYSFITLTTIGERIAKGVVRHHRTLKDFFASVLFLEPDEAEANACRVEHAMSEKAMARLAVFVEFARRQPEQGDAFPELFRRSLPDPE